METTLDNQPKFKQTTSKREFWGFACASVWYSSTYLNYNDTLMNPEENWVAFFTFAVGVSAIIFAILFNKRTQALSALAFYITPVVILITALDHLARPPVHIALYIFSGILIGPILVRRAYGMMRTAQPNKRFIRFMMATSCGPIFNMVAFFIPEAHIWLWYAIIAAALVPGWIGVRRIVPDMPEPAIPPNTLKPWRSVVLVVVSILLFHIMAILASSMHTFLFNIGQVDDFPIITLIAVFLPVLADILFGWFSDKKWERQGFLIAMTIVLVGMFVILVPGYAYSIPVMSIANGLGGNYGEFFMLSFSLYFFTRSKNPMLMAVLGISILTISAGIAWIGLLSPEAWFLPDAGTVDFRVLKELEPGVFAAMGICVALIIVVVLWLQMHNNERALAVVLAERLYDGAADTVLVPGSGDAFGTVSVSAAEPGETVMPDAEAFENIGILAAEEQRIATLLIEGYTKGEISRKLKLQAGEVSESLASIRNKISGRDRSFETTDADTLLARAAAEYKLTTRESQILRGFYEGKTNAEIAQEFFVSESTVKTHINNLFKKLPVKNRAEIREWLLASGETVGELSPGSTD